MKISGIIFDKDGTLLDFNEFWIPAAQCVIRRILSDYKIPVTDIHTEKALNSIGIIQNHVLPDGSFAWKTFLDMAIDMKPALEAMHAQAPVDTRDLEGKLTRYFDEESFAENKSIKGIGDLPAILQPLHEKSIHFGVATTDTCEAAVKCLKGLQILPLFSFFAGDQMAGDMPLKPDGRIISRAAAYIVCHYTFAKSLNRINLNIGYATWCGVGLIVTSLVSIFAYKEKLSTVGIIGLVLITAGCVMVNAFGNK